MSQFEEDVDRRLDEVASSVSARLEEERAEDLAAFDSLRTAPTRDAVENALQRAHEQGLTSERYPPRVDVAEGTHLYVSAIYGTEQDRMHDPEMESVMLRVEGAAGDVRAWIAWHEDQSAEHVLLKVGRVVQRECNEMFDASVFLKGLADLLDAAYSSPDRRPAIQLCPPQWVITERGVATYGSGRVYTVGRRKLRDDPYIEAHIAEKPWADPESFEEAYMATLALFEKEDSREPPS